MKSAIGRRVGVLTAVVLSTFGLGQAGAGAHATAAAAQAPGTQQASGRLMVAHGDDFSGHNVIMSAQVRTRTGVIPLQVSAAQHSAVMALAGRDVVVTGRPTSGACPLTRSVRPARPRRRRRVASRSCCCAIRTRRSRTSRLPRRTRCSSARPDP